VERGTIDIDRRVEATPTRESEMVALTRDYETLRTVYNELMRKSEDAKVAANLERRQIGEQFKVLDTARLPEKPFSPDRLLFYLSGLGGGLAFGIGLVGLLEYRDSTLRTDHDVITALALPVLATIPAIITREDRQFMRRRRLVFMAAGAVAVVVITGAGLVAWRMNLLQRLF
jgi:capsular polysaccharide biosynthesis protein